MYMYMYMYSFCLCYVIDNLVWGVLEAKWGGGDEDYCEECEKVLTPKDNAFLQHPSDCPDDEGGDSLCYDCFMGDLGDEYVEYMEKD